MALSEYDQLVRPVFTFEHFDPLNCRCTPALDSAREATVNHVDLRISRRAFRRLRRQVIKRGGAIMPYGEVVEPEDFAPVKVRLRCEGHMHLTLWYPGGSLVLEGHSPADRAARLTLGDMGAKDCKCVALLQQVRSGGGVHSDRGSGLPGYLTRAFRRASEVAQEAKHRHDHQYAINPFTEYDPKHGREGYYMPPAALNGGATRKEWLDNTLAFRRSEMAEALGIGRYATPDEPLSWLLAFRRGLGVVQGIRVSHIVQEQTDRAVVMLRGSFMFKPPIVGKEGVDVSGVATLPAVVLRTTKRDARNYPVWKVGAWLGPDGETCRSAERAAALHVLKGSR